MKYLIAIALFAAICAVAKSEDVCHTNVVRTCESKTLSATGVCNSRYGGIDHVESDMQAYINSHLAKSYEYLLLATHFNSYQKNRPGFNKLFQGLSDRSFDLTIDLIKQLTRRGGAVDFNRLTSRITERALEVNEFHSLAHALDNEKMLADEAITVHNSAIHSSKRDPETAQFIEEKFLASQADTIRKLSGYTNDLSKMIGNADPSLALYLFDEYLQKQ